MPDSRNNQTQIQLKTDLSLAQLKDEVVSLEQALNQLIRGKKMSREYSSETSTIEKKLQQVPIAIVGMASIFPKARNLQEYWTNIIQEIDCITDVPPSRWNVEDYYDPNPKAPDKTYSKRGGFIPDVDFNPLEFGLPPNILELTDISQLLSLVIAKEAMEDSGYGESRQFNRERTGVVLGVALARQLSIPLAARLQYPIWKKVLKSFGLSDEDTQKAIEKLKLAYVKWEENAFPGMLANVVSGRIANRLDLGGMNCVVDAACASSLGALKMAISELSEYRSDMMITGGVDTDNSILAYMCFSKTPAVSKSENVKPFDADSDGMMLGEGIGMMVLKRLEDAERDHDKIYAVIRGIGTSSDGRYKSIYAPRPEGQVKALRRAYENAGFSPSTVGLIEAHGTGTMTGDPTEFAALKEAFSENNPNKQHIALGSVKSQIGHTKAAAGAASLIKTALALHHKVLPPTLNITKPNPKLDIENSPFYLNTATRPWIRAEGEGPRRAGVSSFGFGGTNYHVILEEYESEHHQAYRLHKTPQSILLFAPTPEQLLARCEDILQKLQSDAVDRQYAELVDACKAVEVPLTNARLGFVANSVTEACNLLRVSLDWLKNKAQAEAWNHPQGIYYRQTGLHVKGKVVALFSGQGSQYLEMGRELAINFPCLRQIYGYMDSLLLKDGLKSLSETVFPPPEFDPEKKNRRVEALQRTEYAQPAIGALSVGLYKILQQAGFKPDFVAGHSFGELTALWAAEVLSDDDYFFLVKARGQAMATPDEPNFDAGAMLAVKEELSKVEAVVKDFPQVAIANLNSNRQVVLAGPTAEIAKVRQALQERGYSAVLLPVSAAFHTPLIEHAQNAFARASEAVTFKTPKVPVYTNVSGNLYPTEPQAIQGILETHLSKSVLFKQEIEKIYADGGYCFVEFGPRNILTNLVKDILHSKPHVAVALNASRQKDSDRQLREAVVQLRVVGLPLQNLDPYQVESKVPEAPKGKVLSVCLNSSNYVSEKTKADFEKALQDGYQVQLPAITAQVGLVERDKTQLLPALVQSAGERSGHTVKSSTNGSHMSTLNNTPSSGSQRNGHAVKSSANGNGNGNGHAVKSSLNGNGNGHAVKSSLNSSGNGHAVKSSANGSEAAHNSNSANKASNSDHSTSRLSTLDIAQTQLAPVPAQSVLESKMQSAPEIPLNYQRVLESLEYTLTQFNQHQGETLQVHGQYLNHQMEYAKTFFQLMQQQNSLFANGKSAHQLPQAKSIVLDSLERSMMQFHNHEAETLRIHEQYLNHQVEYTKHFFQLIQQEYSQLITGDLPHQLVVSAQLAAPDTSDRKSPAASSTTNVVAKQDTSLTPSAIPTSLAVSNTKPVVQNGSNSAEESLALTTETKSVPQNGSKPVEESVALTTETEPAVIETPAPSTSIDVADLSQALLAIVSDKTGYPAEMLELGMDMEADLGIDSIKRVEILGAIQELYPDLPKPNPEELAELRTLGQIVEHLHCQSSGVTPVQVAPLQGVEATSPPVTTVDANPDPTLGDGAKPVEESVALTTETEPAVIETPAPSTSIDVADLSQALLAIVSDKTGYPAEMLELGMDMEADLGIDSIKRVEILGAVQELYPDLPKPNPEELAELRTLGQIVEHLQGLAVEEKKKSQPESDSQPPSLSHNILRSPVRLKVLPEPDFLEFTLPEKHIGLLTDDGSLTTSILAQSLKEQGWNVVVLSFPQSLIAERVLLPEGIDRVELKDLSEEHLKQQLAAITSNYGPVAAFIHLNPSSRDDRRNGVRYLEAEATLLKHVFLIAKHLKEPLGSAALLGRSCFLTVARLDGKFGLGGKINFGVVGSGLFGLTKSLNQEWEPVFCRAIDLSSDLDEQTSVQYLLAELYDPNRLIAEVGYSSQGRATLVCEPSVGTELMNGSNSRINPTSVFLVSGGAKGITAQSVIKLAQHHKCKFILLGRSSMAEREPEWAKDCFNELELKKRIMEALLAQGEKPTPASVQKTFNAITSKREIEQTLQAIAQAGGQAEYISVDVTDAAALQEKLTAVVERLGPVTGIVHGAGNLADKRIEKKSERDFDTVYAAKVKGLENLLHCVSASQLDYLVLFSSVVGFYGNVGQTDYAIANEILNKSAHLVKQSHPNCHVVAINWGPWESGMVTPELKQAFAERNIETIPIAVGTQLLVDELTPANGETVQVVIGSPLVPIPNPLNSELQTYRIHRRLTSSVNPFLQDHVIAGRPVLPATCAIAWITNTCEQLYPGYKLFSYTNFKVLKGIIFDETLANDYLIDIKEIAKTHNNEIELEAKLWSKNQAGKPYYHFSIRPKLVRQIPAAPAYDLLKLPLEKVPYSSQWSYQNSALFHGPSFQGVKRILNITSNKITLECVLAQLGERQQGQFPVQTYNPYIMDVQIHSMWLWTEHHYQEGCLPSGIEAFEQFAAIPFGKSFYISCEIKSKTESSVVADVIAHDLEGHIYSRKIGAKGTIVPLTLKR